MNTGCSHLRKATCTRTERRPLRVAHALGERRTRRASWSRGWRTAMRMIRSLSACWTWVCALPGRLAALLDIPALAPLGNYAASPCEAGSGSRQKPRLCFFFGHGRSPPAWPPRPRIAKESIGYVASDLPASVSSRLTCRTAIAQAAHVLTRRGHRGSTSFYPRWLITFTAMRARHVGLSNGREVIAVDAHAQASASMHPDALVASSVQGFVRVAGEGHRGTVGSAPDEEAGRTSGNRCR